MTERQQAQKARPLQAKGIQRRGGEAVEQIHQSAEAGVSGGGGALPFAERIQHSFGSFDVSGIRAHTGGAAQRANEQMGSMAYATGNNVAFRGAPDLFTAAHEAAHVIQQRAGVQLRGGVGETGDRYEQHADAVAARVVQGKSAEDLLADFAGAGGAGIQNRSVQHDGRGRRRAPTTEMTFEEGETVTVDTYQLAAGARPYDILQNYWNAVAEMIDVMGTNHLSGIANFIDTMQFEGSQSGQADVLGSIFKSVGKSLLDAAIDGIAGLVPIPGFSAVVGWVKDAVEAATDEVERAGRAGAQANLAAWARDIRSSQASTYGTARMEFRRTAEAELPSAFEALDGNAPSSPTEGTVVTGDKATMLRNMERHRTAFRSAIPSAGAFQDATAVRWATSRSAGGAGTASDRGVSHLSNGRLRIWVDSDEDDGEWTFTVERATLYTASHQAQAADLIRESIRSGRKTLWNCGIPVEIMMRGPNNMPGGRTWYQCSVSGPQRANGRGPWWPEADVAWRDLLRRGSVWTEMENVTRSRLEGNE